VSGDLPRWVRAMGALPAVALAAVAVALIVTGSSPLG
jgi:hypothetical protein